MNDIKIGQAYDVDLLNGIFQKLNNKTIALPKHAYCLFNNVMVSIQMLFLYSKRTKILSIYLFYNVSLSYTETWIRVGGGGRGECEGWRWEIVMICKFLLFMLMDCMHSCILFEWVFFNLTS